MSDKMTQFLLQKILSFLAAKHGYSMSFDAEDTAVVVQDSMGFRFRITVEPQGRTQLWCSIDEFAARLK